MHSTGEIREIASQILEDYGFSGVYPVPIDEIIKSHGYDFKGINQEDAPKDFCGLVDHTRKLVVINKSHSNGRKRFTSAHELGHIILHPNENEVDYRISFSDNDPKETEANKFAAEILMPYDDFILVYKSKRGCLSSIADFFGVSIGAATIRAESLNLMD